MRSDNMPLPYPNEKPNESNPKEVYTKVIMDDNARHSEYLLNLEFQKIIGFYQILLGLLIALFAFFLGLSNYIASLVMGVLLVYGYYRYDKELNEIQSRVIGVWNDYGKLTKTEKKKPN